MNKKIILNSFTILLDFDMHVCLYDKKNDYLFIFNCNQVYCNYV